MEGQRGGKGLVMRPRGVCVNKTEVGKSKHMGRPHEETVEKGVSTSYVCVYEPQHKTDGRERVREGQILRNKGDSGVGQSESNGKKRFGLV